MKLKLSLARLLLPPSALEKLRAVRSRRFQVRLLKKAGLLDAAARYIEKNGCTVQHGPFAGTIYPSKAALTRHSIPKLLGTYEQELHGIISKVRDRKYDLVIDIGSAEGYYAVGLARLLQVKVYAYDPEPIERAFCEQAARLNNVGKLVELKDLFRPSDIQRFRDLRVLCICDCEGFEANIFNAGTIDDTCRWDLIIELHGDAESKLRNLPWPHKVTVVSMMQRNGTFKELEGLGDPEKLLSEYRGSPQTWLWCDSLA